MAESKKLKKCVNYLFEKETHKIKHSKTSLFEHLINVFNILKSWKCSEEICFAGLFHSIYGNEIFKIQVEKDREKIKDLIGQEAEKIVFDFNQNRNISKETSIVSLANDLDHV